jgi:hypothetical protein
MWQYRRYMWDRFSAVAKKLYPIDVVVGNGDLIDGRGERNGSQEIIVLDRILQAKMACAVIGISRAKSVVITRGTDYHVGDIENWEDLVAEDLKADRVGDVVNLEVNGLMFNLRHHIGGSQTPIGRGTALAREQTWNALWHVRHDFPLADVIIRSHVHYHEYLGGPGWLAMVTPGLQGYGTRYGERRLSGVIDWGFVVFDVTSKEDYSWRAYTFPFPAPPPLSV